MKVFKRISTFVLALLLLSTTLFSDLSDFGAITAQAATKKGLKKENGNYYYYSNGKKVTKKWKTVNGHRYYFGSNGKAYKATTKQKNTYAITLKTIKGKRYGFDTKSHACNGIYVSEKNEKIYYFNSRGVYKPTKTKKIRSAVKKAYKYRDMLEEAEDHKIYVENPQKPETAVTTLSSAELAKIKSATDAVFSLIGTPKKKNITYGTTGHSCLMGCYTDVTYKYNHFYVSALVIPGTDIQIIYDIFTR